MTVRELLEEYLARHPQGSRIQLDRKTHALGIPQPFRWENVWQDFRKWHGI